MPLQIKAIRVARIVRPNDVLDSVFTSIKKLRNGDIVAVTSKVVSLCEGRVITKETVSRDELIISQAERYVPRDKVPGRQGILAVANSILTLAAGVDEFNGSYVLWPEDPQASARRIWKLLTKKFTLKMLGVIITDSHTVPLRRGLIGFALGWWGFAPLRSYIGRKNLFGRTMKMTQTNLADGLAAAAVLTMGEGGERTPLAVVSGAEGITFLNSAYRPKNRLQRFEVLFQEDLFYPLLSGKMWKKKK